MKNENLDDQIGRPLAGFPGLFGRLLSRGRIGFRKSGSKLPDVRPVRREVRPCSVLGQEEPLPLFLNA